ncbi:MAG: MFS transporter [Opitutales bacterium]|jgi:FSR family fosmidomycin resistance protein-like MFS transporter
MKTVTGAPPLPPAVRESRTALAVLFAISCGHLFNDTIQAVLPAIYPLLKDSLSLSFAQIGLITLAFQLTASLLQPLVGIYTDRHPQPFSLVGGMGLTLAGVVLLSAAGTFELILIAAALIGMGSSVFHPESSRVARMASGGKHGFAQSLFQVGGNAGSAFGPLLAALFVAHGPQSRLAWFAVIPLLGMWLLRHVGHWYREHLAQLRAHEAKHGREAHPTHPPGRVIMAVSILIALIFSKYFYLACMSSYYTFYLIDRFQVTLPHAQIFLFLFMGSTAAGTIIGGPVGDRIGRKYVIWVSILGVTPFTLLLPYANLYWCAMLSVVIGVVLSSAFSAILVYAQELMPHRVGLVSGLFFGLAFGMGGLGSALLGILADHTSIEYVFKVCSYLPLIGLLTAFLPQVPKKKAQ